MKRKKTKKILSNKNQKSFYFEDYIETNIKQKNLSKEFISEDRIYILFFIFFCLISIFVIKITFVSIQSPELFSNKKNDLNFLPLRRDIVDRNGEIISRNIKSYHAAIRPSLIKDKKKFLINIRLNFPEIPQERLKKKLLKNKYFYLKKRLTEDEKNKLWALGEKGIIFEPTQSRIYPHAELYSHILGQIDDDNYGISGVERFYDKNLKNLKKINEPLKLTLDTNIQYLIKNELEKSIEDFKAIGAAGLLMDIKTGEVLSLVSLPDYNINLRDNISSSNYTNKITKGVFELGSIFKTFTIALALEKKLLTPDTVIENIPNKIKCSKYTISEHDKLPSNLSVKEILIRSSNIGSVLIAQKIGEESYKNFLKELKLLETPKFELEEVGTPINFRWDKCKLETVSYGHGITTTPLQAASAYATISNGGNLIQPTLYLDRLKDSDIKKIISNQTSEQLNKILREVVTNKNGTASLADVFGFQVGGKTGTAKKNFYGEYSDKKLNTFISLFPMNNPKHVLLVLLDEPKPAPNIVYNYRGQKISTKRNESGWNSVYVAGKIIEKIGPILAINNNEVYNNHVVEKFN
tara:strand:+ start:1366 stop:3105 length:1740 start_codon:yes stop_codon:yes gene_type:complete